MAGLDPAIHPLQEDSLQGAMDCRVKPGNDEDTGDVSEHKAAGHEIPSQLIRLAHYGGDPCPSSTSHHPPDIKAPPLSFAARVGDLLFISGIPGFDDEARLPDSFEAQFANVVTNIKRVLDEAGATFRDLVKVNVLLTRASDVATMNALYAAAFGRRALSRPHHLRGAGAARSEDADRDRGRRVAGGALALTHFTSPRRGEVDLLLAMRGIVQANRVRGFGTTKRPKLRRRLLVPGFISPSSTHRAPPRVPGTGARRRRHPGA